MKKLISILTAVLLLCCCFAPALAETGTGNGDGTGSGGGTKTPTLDSISVGSVTETSAVVTFVYSNNIGAEASHNEKLFWAKDASGEAVSFTMHFESEGDARRNAVMRLSGLKAGCEYTVGVKAGVKSKNGQTSPDSGKKSFTTQGAATAKPTEKPTAEPTATAKPTPKPTATAKPTARPTATPKPTATAKPTPSAKPTATPSAAPTATAAFPAWDGEATATPVASAVVSNEPGSGGGTGGGSNEPLSVTASEPSEGQRDVATDAIIKLEFTKNVVYYGVRETNAAAIKLFAGEREIPVEIIMADDQIERDLRHEIRVKPKEPLAEGTEYTLTVGTTLSAKNGMSLAEPYTLTFYTVGWKEPAGFPAWAIIAICAAVAAVLIFITLRSRRGGARRRS